MQAYHQANFIEQNNYGKYHWGLKAHFIWVVMLKHFLLLKYKHILHQYYELEIKHFIIILKIKK